VTKGRRGRRGMKDENTEDGEGWQPVAGWHTRTWYLKNFFVDPAEHDLPYHEYAAVRWWREEDVLRLVD